MERTKTRERIFSVTRCGSMLGRRYNLIKEPYDNYDDAFARYGELRSETQEAMKAARVADGFPTESMYDPPREQFNPPTDTRVHAQFMVKTVNGGESDEILVIGLESYIPQ